MTDEQVEQLTTQFAEQIRAAMVEVQRCLATFLHNKVASGELTADAAEKCKALVTQECNRASESIKTIRGGQ